MHPILDSRDFKVFVKLLQLQTLYIPDVKQAQVNLQFGAIHTSEACIYAQCLHK